MKTKETKFKKGDIVVLRKCAWTTHEVIKTFREQRFDRIVCVVNNTSFLNPDEETMFFEDDLELFENKNEKV